MLKGPGRGFCDDSGQAGCPAFRDEDAVDSGRLSGSNNRAKIVGVLNPVEYDKKRCLAFLTGQGKDVFRIVIRLGRDKGDDPLMVAFADQAIERRRRLDMDRNLPGLGLLYNVGKLPIGPLNEKTLKRSAAGTQRFTNGMQAVQQIRPTIASSGWCRRACPR